MENWGRSGSNILFQTKSLFSDCYWCLGMSGNQEFIAKLNEVKANLIESGKSTDLPRKGW